MVAGFQLIYSIIVNDLAQFNLTAIHEFILSIISDHLLARFRNFQFSNHNNI